MIRKNFFIKKRWFLLILGVQVYAIIYWHGWYLFLTLLAGGYYLWLYRRREIPWRESLNSEGELYLSPVDGEIIQIGTWVDPEAGFSYEEIKLRVGLRNYWGLHLPLKAETEFLKSYPGKRIHRKNLIYVTTHTGGEFLRTDLVFRHEKGQASRLRFLPCETGSSPKIWMKSGDQGRGAACFGYYPFGGSLVVYIPQPCDVLVVENERITAGQTVLAVVNRKGEEQHGN